MYNHQELGTMISVKSDTWTEQIQRAYGKDSVARVLQEGTYSRSHIDKNGTILWNGRIYIPTTLRERLTHEEHKHPANGHQGVD